MKKLTKEANKAINDYIIEAISWDGYEVDLSEATDKEKLQFVADQFKATQNYANNLKKFPNHQERLGDWLQGLPSVFNIDFENYRILELAKEWGSIPENATEKQEDLILDGWWRFISAKIISLMCKNGISLR